MTKNLLIVLLSLALAVFLVSCSTTKNQKVLLEKSENSTWEDSSKSYTTPSQEGSVKQAEPSFAVLEGQSAEESYNNKQDALLNEDEPVWSEHHPWVKTEWNTWQENAYLSGFTFIKFGYNSTEQIWGFYQSKTGSRLVLYDAEKKFVLDLDLPPAVCIKGQNKEIILFSEEKQTFYFYDDTTFALNRSIQLGIGGLEIKNNSNFKFIDISPDNTKLAYANPRIHIWDFNSRTLLYETDVGFGPATSGMFVDNQSIIGTIYRPLDNAPGSGDGHHDAVLINFQTGFERVLLSNAEYFETLATASRIYFRIYMDGAYKMLYYPIDEIYTAPEPALSALQIGDSDSKYYLNEEKTLLLEFEVKGGYPPKEVSYVLFDATTEEKLASYSRPLPEGMGSFGYVQCIVSKNGNIAYSRQERVDGTLWEVRSMP